MCDLRYRDLVKLLVWLLWSPVLFLELADLSQTPPNVLSELLYFLYDSFLVLAGLFDMGAYFLPQITDFLSAVTALVILIVVFWGLFPAKDRILLDYFSFHQSKIRVLFARSLQDKSLVFVTREY